jgi:hypothetical protein
MYIYFINNFKAFKVICLSLPVCIMFHHKVIAYLQDTGLDNKERAIGALTDYVLNADKRPIPLVVNK